MRFWSWLNRRRDAELDEEIQAHLRMAVHDRIARGEPAETARLSALREFGNQGLVREVTRQQWGGAWAGHAARDLRFAARMLRQNRGFTLAVTLTLALGVGANSAIFSVMRAVLAPLPTPQPDRVVAIWTDNPGRGIDHWPASVPDYRDWRTSGLFSSMGAMFNAGFNLRLGDRTERIDGIYVDSGFFDVLKMQPQLGRLFTAQEMQPGGGGNAVLLPDKLWRSRFAASRAAIGSTLVLDGSPRTVIGVLPKSFSGFFDVAVCLPLTFEKAVAEARDARFIPVIGRLRPGITLAAAQQSMATLTKRMSQEFPEDRNNTVVLQTITEADRANSQALTLVMPGAVGFVLLIACANIANLLLARGAARAREMTIRAALGASRWQLCRQLLGESLLLSLLGGAAALLPAELGIRLITSFQADPLPDPDQVTFTWSVLAFNFALALGTGLVFGLLPAWQACNARAGDALKAASRFHSGGGRQRLRNLFVVSELALTLVLLVGAGLMLRSFEHLRSAWPGYRSQGLLTAKIELAEDRYNAPSKIAGYYGRVLREARALPGVRNAAATAALPSDSALWRTYLHFTDRPEPRPQDAPFVVRIPVSSGYFQTLRIPLRRGRLFEDADDAARPAVAIIDEETARRYWPHGQALGQRVRIDSGQAPGDQREIVGVVGAVDQGGPLASAIKREGQLYLPAAQYPALAMTLVIEANGDPLSLTPALRRVAHNADLDQPLFAIQTLDAARAPAWRAQELAAWLLGAFGLMALLLAAVGVYGVMAYSIGRRTREFGIRISLGAQPRDILSLAGRQAIALNATGIAAGLAGSYALTRLLSSLLYRVRPTDPATFGAVTIFLGAVTLLAAYLAARRATRVDPVHALREE